MESPRLAAQQLLKTLLRDWRADQALQARVPPYQGCRGCLGLAALVDRFDHHAVASNDHVLLPNHAITWLALYDLPSRYPFGRPFHPKHTLACRAKATLAYGMPHLDFRRHARDSWDFSYMPRHARLQRHSLGPYVLDACSFGREWAVLNRLSHAMTSLAFFGQWRNGTPFRRAWTYHRPQPPQANYKLPVTSPEGFMPRPFVALGPRDVSKLQFASAKASSQASCAIYRIGRRKSLYPAARLSHLGQRPSSEELWWDFTPAASLLDCGLEAFLFPPDPITTVDSLRFQVSGCIDRNLAGLRVLCLGIPGIHHAPKAQVITRPAA